MPIERISSVYRANNRYKGFNSYHKSKRIKITELPINEPVVEESVWGRPWHYVVIIAVLVGIGLLNGLIGG